MKILITGIGGFVGPYLAENLKNHGYDVYGIERHGSGSDKIFLGDILDTDFLSKTINDLKPDLIFHLAGFSSVQKSFSDPELCMKINVQGTKNILELLSHSQKKTRLVVISSAEIYGIPKLVPIAESHPLKPTSPYGQSRLAQEDLISSYPDHDIVILRSFNHTGPGQQSTFVVSDFAKQIIEIEKGMKDPTVHVGNLEAVRDFTDVRDIVEAYRCAIEKAQPHTPYNVCSGTGDTIASILEKLIALSGLTIEIVQDSARTRPSDVPKLIGSHDRFTEATGWHPQIPFERTLSDMLDWWRLQL